MQFMLKGTDSLIKASFGSKKGALRFLRSKFEQTLGQYSRHENVDWALVNRMVFICQGNICRSPLGEAAARNHGIEAISYGLSAPDGDPADPRAIAFATSHGLDLMPHRTRRIDRLQATKNDLIIAMEPAHIDALIQLPLNGAQLTLLGLWLAKPRPYLHDPFNTSSRYFTFCEEMVLTASIQLAALCKLGNRSNIESTNCNG